MEVRLGVEGRPVDRGREVEADDLVEEVHMQAAEAPGIESSVATARSGRPIFGLGGGMGISRAGARPDSSLEKHQGGRQLGDVLAGSSQLGRVGT